MALQNQFGNNFINYESKSSENVIAEQIQLFQQAKLVLGPHGAGLTNLIWTPPG